MGTGEQSRWERGKEEGREEAAGKHVVDRVICDHVPNFTARGYLSVMKVINQTLR